VSHRVDPGMLSELIRYGTVNIEACFNCGNCSAVCPLSSEGDSFRRRMIRYAQLGMRDKLLSSKELWLCYSCGECTTTCPRQANPGEFMAAARRYAIARYDRLGLAQRLASSGTFTVLFLTALAVVLSVLIYSLHGPMPADALHLFEFIPAEVIHTLGVTAGILIVIVALSGIVTMTVQLGRASQFPRGGAAQLGRGAMGDTRRSTGTTPLSPRLRDGYPGATLVYPEMVCACRDAMGIHGVIPGDRP
jgi:ferredoxin